MSDNTPNTQSGHPLAGTYKPNINRKRKQPRQAIRHLLRSFEPLEPPKQRPATLPHSGGN